MSWKKKIKVYQDGADLKKISQSVKTDNFVRGFTTNPSLMKKSGVKNYLKFCKDAAKIVKNKPISFEVFADDETNMIKQAEKIHEFIGKKNVYIKIPIVNSKGKSTLKVIKYLANKDIPLNITAVFTKKQIDGVLKNIKKFNKVIISVFAGRIADTLKDPVPYILYAKRKSKNFKNVEILWASTREILNIQQAINANCDIITIPDSLFSKFKLINYPLKKLSIDTVQMFLSDAKSSNYKM
tara:strand:- start:1854 stop:2573 length:720 start_codon:yes stop_codon:yes gene_type:complete